MADATVVLNETSSYGLRTVHVMQDGERPRVEAHLNKVPAEGMESLNYLVLTDKDLKGMWHLWMFWHAHEVVKVHAKVCGRAEDLVGVMWYIEKGQTLRTEIRNAALRYLVEFDKWPEICLMRRLPKDCPEAVEWEGDLQIPKVRVQMGEAGWVPERCVYVIAPPPTPPQMKTTFGEGSQKEGGQ